MADTFDETSKQALITELDAIAAKLDPDLLDAILRAYRRSGSFRMVNSVLAKYGSPLTETAFRALLSNRDKLPPSAINARGSPPCAIANDGSTTAGAQPSGQASRRSKASIVWECALNGEPIPDFDGLDSYE